MPSFTLRQMEYFIACAELGSMRAASEVVHLSQSAVSTSIADLETNLGVQLLIRHSRGLSLTQAGMRVLAEARQLVGSAEDIALGAKEVGQGLSGKLRIGCYSTLAPVLLPRIIADFTDNHPAVELDIVEGSYTQLEEELQSGRCELVLAYDQRDFGETIPSDLEARRISGAPPHIVLPANHRFAIRQRISLREIIEEPFILFDLPPGGEYFLDIFSQTGLMPKVRFRTQSFETARSLVARGLGYTILSQRTSVSQSYEGRELVVRPLAEEMPDLSVVTLKLAAMRPTKRARAFAKQCVDSLADG